MVGMLVLFIMMMLVLVVRVVSLVVFCFLLWLCRVIRCGWLVICRVCRRCCVVWVFLVMSILVFFSIFIRCCDVLLRFLIGVVVRMIICLVYVCGV